MFVLDSLDGLFVVCAFIFQIVLVNFFALRKWHFELALRLGPFVYALGVPAAVVSILLLLNGKPWLSVAGFVYLAWGIFGFVVEYVRKIQWRNPVRWVIYIPYVFLFLTTAMFYWWPLAYYGKSLWYGYAMLFLASSLLNATSHGRPAEPPAEPEE